MKAEQLSNVYGPIQSRQLEIIEEATYSSREAHSQRKKQEEDKQTKKKRPQTSSTPGKYANSFKTTLSRPPKSPEKSLIGNTSTKSLSHKKAQLSGGPAVHYGSN